MDRRMDGWMGGWVEFKPFVLSGVCLARCPLVPPPPLPPRRHLPPLPRHRFSSFCQEEAAPAFATRTIPCVFVCGCEWVVACVCVYGCMCVWSVTQVHACVCNYSRMRVHVLPSRARGNRRTHNPDPTTLHHTTLHHTTLQPYNPTILQPYNPTPHLRRRQHVKCAGRLSRGRVQPAEQVAIATGHRQRVP